MIFNKENRKFILKVLIFLSWVAMWVSINSMPGELLYMDKNIFTFINGMRTINALIFSFFISGFAIFFLIKKDLNKNTLSLVLIIFFIHFISQFAGLLLNEDRSFDLNNTYLVIYSLGTISLLYLIQKFSFYDVIPILMYFLIFILILSIIGVIYFNFENLKDLVNHKNLYYLIHPDISLNYQAQPRITGFSRTLSIISIFLTGIYLINNKKFYSNIILIIIFFLSVIIWLAQSRGTIICFYITSAILVFLLNNLSFLRKFFVFLFITFFPIITSNAILTININTVNDFVDKVEIKNEKPKENASTDSNSKVNEKVDVNKIITLKESRFYTQRTTSGRSVLWKKSLEYYDLNNIFGYGPQADRFILYELNNKYGNNVSNASLYAFLSGGYPSLISIIFLYIYAGFLILKFFINNKLYKFSYNLNSENSLLAVAICYCIFFMIRSIIENSFTVFSIDFLITIFSIFIVEKKFRENF